MSRPVRIWQRGGATVATAEHALLHIPMHKPVPQPVDPAEVPELARKAMREARFPCLATID